MEKRSHPRFESRFEARLIGSDGTSHDCHITDFSQDGLQLLWQEESQPSCNPQDIMQLYLTIEDKPMNVAVQCLYQQDNYAGFKLNQANQDLFLKLQSLNQATRNRGGLDEEKRASYKTTFEQRVKETTQGLIRQWHGETLDEIFNHANKAHNNTEQQAFFAAEKVLKENSDNIQAGFLRNIAEQLGRWHDGKPKLESEHQQREQEADLNLSLVQQDDFEDWLLTKVTSTHLQSRLSHASFEVRQLLDMISEAPAENCFNPLGPNVVTEAFQGAIEKLDLDSESRRIAFDVFEQVAGNQLQAVYQWLIKQIDIPLAYRYRRRGNANGNSAAPAAQAAPQQPSEEIQQEPQILPDSGQAQGMPTAAPQPAPANPVYTGQNSGGYTAPSYTTSLDAFRAHQAEARQAYSNIQNLLSLRYQRIESGIGGQAVAEQLVEAGHQVAEHNMVQNTLQQLWQQQNTATGHIRQDLESALANQEMVLPAESREAIDTLEHVTQTLVDNDKISDFIKPFINQLEQPLSMLMLKDPSMIFNPEHPGRLTLNAMSKLGKLTTTGHKQVADKLQTMLEQVDSGSDNLEQQLVDFQNNINTLVMEAERRARMNADRVAQAAEGEHRVDQARLKISRLVSKDCSGRVLPAIVMEWLEQGWKPLLTLIYLREGAESKRCRGAVKLYRQVLTLFNPANQGRMVLLDKFTPLMKLMRHELDQLNGPRPDHDRWFEEISQAAEQHISSKAIEDVVEVPEVEAEQESELDRESKGVRRALNLQVGDWLLLVESDQTVSIVWIAEDASKFACVNHSGMKVVDFTLEELAAALDEGEVKRLYEQDESAVDQSLDALVKQIYSDLSAQANTDSLTQLNTRQHFMRHLKEEVLKAHRSNLTHTLCMIDIDEFKLINSEYGVEGGDECLKAVATALQQAARNGADAARMGSNEFALLFQHKDLTAGETAARDLKKTLEQMNIESGAHKFRIHVSMGVSELTYQVADETDLVEFAESACLLAKEKGGSRVYRYIEDDNARIKRDEFMSWANKLNQALESNQLQLLCQPLIAIQEAEKELRQYEVIISIEGENGSQIPPLEYLQASEHYSRMHLVDRWTLEQLIIWMSNHQQEVNQIDRFMLKLSGYSMNDDSLLAFIFEQAREHDVPVDKLCFELNETSAIQNIEDAADFMHEMRSLGCEFTLSDFGTGQSSFEYLKQLPVNYVKIDHTFIDELVSSSADYAMVESIHEIAHFMAKKTIAEQVNSEDTLDILRSIGIDLAMGGELKQAIPLQQLANRH